MGVYIPNMSKPLTCDECIVPLSRCDYLQGRAIKCPLIEIDENKEYFIGKGGWISEAEVKGAVEE